MGELPQDVKLELMRSAAALLEIAEDLLWRADQSYLCMGVGDVRVAINYRAAATEALCDT